MEEDFNGGLEGKAMPIAMASSTVLFGICTRFSADLCGTFAGNAKPSCSKSSSKNEYSRQTDDWCLVVMMADSWENLMSGLERLSLDSDCWGVDVSRRMVQELKVQL